MGNNTSSPEMWVGVCASIITLLTIVVRGILDGREKKRQQAAALEEKTAALEEIKMRRQWEVEDREFKLRQEKTAEDAKRAAEEARKAAAGAALVASKSSKRVEESIQESRGERKGQLDTIREEIKASSAASAEALNTANGHNKKIEDLTHLATQVLEHNRVTVTTELAEKPVAHPGES